jgi:hypothetical protein
LSEDEIKKKKYLSLTLTKKILKNFNEQDEKVLFFSQNIASMKSKAVLGYIYIFVSVIIVDEKKCTRYQIMRHHSPSPPPPPPPCPSPTTLLCLAKDDG